MGQDAACFSKLQTAIAETDGTCPRPRQGMSLSRRLAVAILSNARRNLMQTHFPLGELPDPRGAPPVLGGRRCTPRAPARRTLSPTGHNSRTHAGHQLCHPSSLILLGTSVAVRGGSDGLEHSRHGREAIGLGRARVQKRWPGCHCAQILGFQNHVAEVIMK